MRKFKKKIVFPVILLTLLFVNSVQIRAEGEYLSEEYIQYTEEIGEMYGICPELIQAVIERESRGKANVTDGMSVGLMQLTPRWHYDRMTRLGVTDLWDPYSNILVGTDYLAELFDKYGDPYLVLMVYNMGDGKALSLYNKGIYSNYAVSICERSAELERLHGK